MTDFTSQPDVSTSRRMNRASLVRSGQEIVQRTVISHWRQGGEDIETTDMFTLEDPKFGGATFTRIVGELWVYGDNFGGATTVNVGLVMSSATSPQVLGRESLTLDDNGADLTAFGSNISITAAPDIFGVVAASGQRAWRAYELKLRDDIAEESMFWTTATPFKTRLSGFSRKIDKDNNAVFSIILNYYRDNNPT